MRAPARHAYSAAAETTSKRRETLGHLEMRLREETEQALALGQANQRAIRLLADHCVHADVEIARSFLGEKVNLPIGTLHIRCRHAPAGGEEGADAMELAVAFCERNCLSCSFHTPTGRVPTIMGEVESRRREREAEAERAARAHAERVAAWQARKTLRQAAAAAGDAAARELVSDLDLVDSDPGGDAERASYDDAARRIAETAKRAPELFSSPLVESVIGFARDVPDPAVWSILEALAKARAADRASVGRAALSLLQTYPLVEAGNCLAEVSSDLPPAELSSVIPALVVLAAGRDDFFDQIPRAPAALFSAFAADRASVIACISGLLQSDDEQQRADAADAAKALLEREPRLLDILGAELLESIREADAGYGEPHPSASAMRALATAWRRSPSQTRRLIESHASKSTDKEIPEELFQIIHFLDLDNEEYGLDSLAEEEATSFLMERLGGDWGQSIATDASTALASLARKKAAPFLAHVDRLLGDLIAICKPAKTAVSSIVTLDRLADSRSSRQQDLLEEFSLSSHVDRRRDDITTIVGKLVSLDLNAVLPRIGSLLEASSGDPEADRRLRRALLGSLARGVTLANVSRLVPILYTHLLKDDQSGRAAAIELWAAIARVVETLPGELAELAPTLLRDPDAIVRRAMLRHLRWLGLPQQVLLTLVDLVGIYARSYATSREREANDLLDEALRDLLYVVDRACEPNEQAKARRFVLGNVATLGRSDRERWLLDQRLSDLRQTPLWAREAWRTFVSRASDPNFRHSPLLAAILEEPRGIAALDIDEFLRVGRARFPRFYGAAVYSVELLQSAGRFGEAASLARELRDAIPETREGAAAKGYLEIIVLAAALEEKTSGTDAPDRAAARDVLRQSLAQASAANDFSEYVRARLDVLEALDTRARSDPAATVDILEQAADAIRSSRTAGLSDRCRKAFAEGLAVAAWLLRYDGAVRRADASAGAHLNAAKRNARLAVETVRSVPGLEAHLAFFECVLSASSADDVDLALGALRRIALPLPLCAAAVEDSPSARRSDTSKESSEPSPVAVCIFLLNGTPVVDVAVLRRRDYVDLTLEMRLDEWPDWAETCEATFLRVLGEGGLRLPTFTLARTDGERTPAGLRYTVSGKLQCDVSRQVGLPPMDFPLLIRFSGVGRDQRADVAGYRRLLVRPFDPSRDRLTEHPQFDQRLLAMFDALKQDRTLDAKDVEAFCRLFAACARAAQKIMFERTFRAGTKVTEAQFHDSLERHLQEDPELEGRLSRRDPVAGGFDDLLHDDVIAELKVERRSPVSVEACSQYLGQPTQYGVGRGSRLSILVVLDHTKKEAPPGVLENYVDWLLPVHHGLDDPHYPSRVGVLIVNANLPIPSAWSKRRIATRDDDSDRG